jgi:hypothetical protein
MNCDVIKMCNCGDRKVSYLLAFTAIVWGAQLLDPFDTFSTSLAFSMMSQIAPEYIWGSLFAGFGFLQLFIIRCDGGHLKPISGYIQLLGVFAWSMVSLFFFIGNPHGTGFIPYLTIMFLSLFCYWDIIRFQKQRVTNNDDVKDVKGA